MAWNKGLTKQDPRVRKYSDKLKGRILTQEWKDKISQAHQGKKASRLHRDKIKVALTGRKRSIQERRNISVGMKGRTFSDETRQKMKEAKFGKKITLEHRDKIKKSWTKKMRLDASQRRARQKIPLKYTSIEVTVHSILEQNKIEYEASYAIDLGFMIHQADIFIKPNKIIELFGTYHHADPFRYSPDQIMKVKGHTTALKIWQEDNQIIKTMTNLGYDVLVIWQDDLKNNPTKANDLVLNFIKKRI